MPIEQHVLPGDQHVIEDDERIDLVEAVGERIVLDRSSAGEAGAADELQAWRAATRQSVSCRRSDGDGFKSVFAAPGELEFSQFWRIDIVKEFVVCAETR
jgi:hypothetical protein